MYVDLEVTSESYDLVEPSCDSRLVLDWFVLGFFWPELYLVHFCI